MYFIRTPARQCSTTGGFFYARKESMTTVCYRDGVLATDSLVTANGGVAGAARKMRVLSDGSVMAHGGVLADAVLVFDWVEKGEKPKDKPVVGAECFEAVRVYPDGRIVWYSGHLTTYSYREHRGFFAFGTGEHFALGALAAGATAEEACRIACEFDVKSAEPVETHRFAARENNERN